MKIDWNAEKIAVKCEDQTEFTSDHVVVTIPHGILKARLESLFVPSLPAYKVDAINELDFGAVGKVFLEFEEKVIPQDVSYYSYFWSEKDLSDVLSSDRAW